MGDQSKQYIQDLIFLSKKNLKAIGWQSLTIANNAGGYALTVPTGAVYALIVVESNITTPAIRYLEIGPSTAVTSSVGIPRSNLDAFDVVGAENLTNFRAIQIGVGTHTLSIQYYK